MCRPLTTVQIEIIASFCNAFRCTLFQRPIYWQNAGMLEMRPDCERCGLDLPAQDAGAFICSFECTFCADCTEDLDERCPNCGGELLDRPARARHLHANSPPSTARHFKG